MRKIQAKIKKMAKNFRLAFEQIKKANNILLVTHAKPDGDAVSSICAMMLILEQIGKNYTAYCKDPAPKQFLFLPRSEKIITNKKDIKFSDFDTIISLDCGSLSRTTLIEEIKTKKAYQKVIEFDHHIKIDNFSEIEVRDPVAASTTEVLYHFIKTVNLRFNKNIANCILTGILTDTANFLYPSTSENTIQIASDMLIYGAKFPQITEEAYRNKSIGAMKLWGKAIENLQINPKYKIAYTILKDEDISTCDCDEEELEGIAGFMGNMDNINALLFLRETKNGGYKGSMRTSLDEIDVSRLANKLGGGGHKKASGFFIDVNIEKENNRWLIK